MPEILSLLHRKALKEIDSSELASFFVWSDGTALAYYYLQHRQSLDLDLMSTDLMPDEYLLAQARKIAEKLQVVKIQEQKKFNRHEFWLKTKTKFPLILKWVKKKFGVEIDPVILVSKILQGADKLNKIKPLILKEEFYDTAAIRSFFKKQANEYLKEKIKSVCAMAHTGNRC